MRQNNKLDMTVIEQIVAIREKMCSDYCKYKSQAEKNPTWATQAIFKEVCEKCPLREL